MPAHALKAIFDCRCVKLEHVTVIWLIFAVHLCNVKMNPLMSKDGPETPSRSRVKLKHTIGR